MGYEEFAVLVVALVVVAAAVRLVVKGGRAARAALPRREDQRGGGRPPASWRVPRHDLEREVRRPHLHRDGPLYVLRHRLRPATRAAPVKPIRRVRWLLVPGVIAVGFLVNIPVISQTSTAVCLGAVVVPLMRAAGYSMATIGACLLLGASVGGELLNPGAPELLTVSAANPKPPRSSPQAQATEYLPPLVFTQLAVSLAVFWAMSFWWERRAATDPATNAAPSPPNRRSRANEPPPRRALVPLAFVRGRTAAVPVQRCPRAGSSRRSRRSGTTRG